MKDLIQSLNPAQREAVEYAGGPMLVVAGAGSGKTRVITVKVAWLIDQGLYRPEEILAVTFTNKAAEEMKERVLALLGDRSHRLPTVCTFHSFCARFLRREIPLLGYPANYSIYDSDDQVRLLKTILKELSINDKSLTGDNISFRISEAKVNGVPPSRYSDKYYRDGDDIVARVYEIYERRMKEAGALDFDDLILKTNEILGRFPEVRERLNRQYRYLLVDEFQDTNPPQFTLVKHFTAGHKNICVVGDEDQSIYGFRGAILANILHFDKDFPGAKVFKLEQNYRCTRSIIRSASAVVANNTRRREKTLWTDNDEGAPVGLYTATDPGSEAFWVTQGIKRILLEDFRAEVGVLYRTNFQSRRVEDALRSQGVKYRIVGGLSFYSRKEVKDLVAYLRLVRNHGDDMAFLRCVNTPPRGVGDRTLEILAETARRHGVSLWDSVNIELGGDSIPTRTRATLSLFRDMIQDLERRSMEMPLGEFLHALYRLSGYQEFLRTSKDPDAQTREENLKELITLAGEHEKEGGDLVSFLDRMALYSSADEEGPTARVVLMTLHGAKGLEFDYVFLVGLEEGLIPHFRAKDNPDDLEEERRLLYVGMTRARKRLTLTHALSRAKYMGGDYEPVDPSRFLQELPTDCLVEYAATDRFPMGKELDGLTRGAAPRLRDQGFQTLDTAADVLSFFQKRGVPVGGRGTPPMPPSPAGMPRPASAPGAGGPRIVTRASEFTPSRPAAPTRPSAPARPGASRPSGPKASGTPGVRPVIPTRAGTTTSGAGPVTRPAISEAGRTQSVPIRTGDRVSHASFGKGVVLRVEPSPRGNKLVINFEGRGTKTLLESIAGIERIR